MAKRYFYGFESGEAKGKGRLKLIQLGPDPAPPAIHKLHDVVALPGQAALYTREGRLIEEARPFTLSPNAPPTLLAKFHSKSRLREMKVPSELRVVDETVMFGGYLRTHYGHFLIDSMSRLWARDLFPALPILFTTAWPRRDQPKFSSEILSALGLSSRVVSVEEPTIFREVICPGTAFEYRWKVFSVADEPHMAAAKTISGGRAWRRPVYLTRTGLPDQVKTTGRLPRQVRKIEDEPELEAELSRRGVEVVLPETLPLSEQISLFRDAPLVIGTTSSAFHTALFSRSSNLCLAILSWGKGNENDMLVDALKQHTSYYIKSMQHHGAEGGYTLDVGLSLRLLEEAGLLAARTCSVSPRALSEQMTT